MPSENTEKEFLQEIEPKQPSAPAQPTKTEEPKKEAAVPEKPSRLENPRAIKDLLSDPELFNKTGMGKERRARLGEKIFSSKLWGDCLVSGEVLEAEKQLALGKWGKYKDFSLTDKKDALKLIKLVKEKMKF